MKYFPILIVATTCFFHTGNSFSQAFVERVGLNYGQATQDIFPLKNRNYSYETTFLKLQLSKTIKDFGNSKLELLVEPSFYWVENQLLNLYFIKPEEYPNNFRSMRERYTQKRHFYEIALNFGVLYRRRIFQAFSMYGLLSIGPMIGSAGTARLRRGFAFSDILGLGFGYEKPGFMIDCRITLQHKSNADLRMPNTGHNSVGLEMGFSYIL